MRVFVTGAASFIGTALLRACDLRGIEVIGIDATDPVRPDCQRADIRDPSIGDLIPDAVDAVVHLAALSRDPDCRGRGYECFDVNVMGTLNVARAARARGARHFTFASSEWVYDSFLPGLARREDDPIDPSRLTSEYALSKLVSECNLRHVFSAGFCPTTVLRFGIVYGPRRVNHSAAEALLVEVARSSEVKVGALRTTRGFIHVDDIADAILASFEVPGFEILNAQGPAPVTLGEVIEVARRITGRDPRVVETAAAAASIRLVSAEKAARVMGWRARICIADGLRLVAQYLELAT